MTALRDLFETWLRSLCRRRADGGWLVQVPSMLGATPRLYRLRDDTALSAYLMKATALARSFPSRFFLVLLLHAALSYIISHVPTRTMALEALALLFPIVLFAGLLVRAWRREAELHTWLGTAGTAASASHAAEAGIPMLSHRDAAIGIMAAQPAWRFAIEVLAFGTSLTLAFNSNFLPDPEYCSLGDKGAVMYGLCLSGESAVMLVVLAVCAGSLLRHYSKRLPFRAALEASAPSPGRMALLTSPAAAAPPAG